MKNVIYYLDIYEKLKDTPSYFNDKKTKRLFNIFSKLHEWKMYQISDYYRKD